MADVAKELFHNRYRYSDFVPKEQILRDLDFALSYADSLCRCGKLKEALEVYESYSRSAELPPDKLKFISHSLLDAILANSSPPSSQTPVDVYGCVVCEGVLVNPTTIPCGHTFCRKCLDRDGGRNCRRCGARYHKSSLETDILVKSLVEKLWPIELEAAILREEGNDLFQQGDLEAALTKYDRALSLVPDNPLILSNRSHALCRLGRAESALVDADLVIKLRPQWGKGHYRRGAALLAMSHFEAALTSFCICVALDRNLNAVRPDAAKALQYLLVKQRRQRLKSRSSPFSTPSTKSLRRNRYFHCPPLSSPGSDGEQSSGEDDFLPPARVNLTFLLRTVLEQVDRLKRMDVVVKQLVIDQSRVQQTDFDCVLCCRTLWQPVTTQCGHSYCMVCFDRCLDYSSSCPLCVKSVANYLVVTPKIVNEFLERCLRTLLPQECESRQKAHAAEVSELAASPCDTHPKIPIFVCTTAFPTVHCPLYIYEPRYRLMVRRCVESGIGQFGIAACVTSEDGSKRYAEFGTVLEIRDWVLRSDGCSFLSTVGMRRFRTRYRGERDGYDTASIEYISDTPVCGSLLPALQDLHRRVHHSAQAWVQNLSPDFLDQIYSTFGTMPPVEENWANLEDGPSWAWWILTMLPLGPKLQISILGTTSLDKRLRAIEKTLQHITRRTPLPMFRAQLRPARSSPS